MKDIVGLTAPLVHQVCQDLGVEVIEIRFVPGRHRGMLRLTIDRESEPVTLGDCEDFSRRLARLLDVNDPIPGSYQLEVSSPGFKRLLRVPKDLHRFTKHRIRVVLSGTVRDRKVWAGLLLNASDPMQIETDVGQVEIPFGLIQKANLDD